MSSPFKGLPSCCTHYCCSLTTAEPAVNSQVASADHRPSVYPPTSRPFSTLIKVKCNSVLCLVRGHRASFTAEKTFLFHGVTYNYPHDKTKRSRAFIFYFICWNNVKGFALLICWQSCSDSVAKWKYATGVQIAKTPKRKKRRWNAALENVFL